MYIFSLFSLIFALQVDSLLSELPGKSFTKFYMGLKKEISTSSFKSSKIQS